MKDQIKPVATRQPTVWEKFIEAFCFIGRTALFLFLMAFAFVFMGAGEAQAVLTADPTAMTTGVESGFDAAALVSIAIAGVVWVARFIKKALRI